MRLEKWFSWSSTCVTCMKCLVGSLPKHKLGMVHTSEIPSSEAGRSAIQGHSCYTEFEIILEYMIPYLERVGGRQNE